MRNLWGTWRRQSREHPSVLVLSLGGLVGVCLGPVLMAARMALVGQFVAGVAVAPLMLALYICLLPPGPWHDDEDGDGGPPGAPPEEPDGGVDWERFERDFWGFVDRPVPVA